MSSSISATSTCDTQMLIRGICCSRSHGSYGKGLGDPIIANDRFSTQFIQIMDRYLGIYSARFVSNAT